jgi:DNA mismatch repair protein MutL
MSSGGPVRIQVLPSSLANQIAAGEVVERPASVLKELVENSFDAGARRLDVEAAGAGIELIRVVDDGIGIHPEDLELALERHATSKLRQAADLEGIHSLGFRGEALPSIASVAALRLTSRIAAAESGRSVEFDPLTGRRRAGPAAHPVGTTVEVRGLFRGVPARRKFLRSERTEYLHLLDMMRRLALSPPAASVRFRHDGHAVLHVEGGAEDRIAEILGRSFLKSTLALDCTDGRLRVHGRIGSVDAHRSQSDQQFLYLNGRLIRDRQISHAIRHAYGDLVPPGRFPLYLLYLEMDAAAADVNVHPTKHEVRFREARDVHDFIDASVRETLAGTRRPAPAVAPAPAAVFEPTPGYSRKTPAPRPPRLGTAIAQLGGRYILSERGGHWLIADARALLRERVLTGLRRALATNQPLRRRPLLVPVYADVPLSAADAVEAHAALLDQFGVELGCIAPGRIIIRAIPALLAEADAVGLGSGILAQLDRGSGAAVIAEWLAGLVPEQPCAGADAGALSALLRDIEEAQLDFDADSHAGLWRSLDANALARLLEKHGR